MRSLSVDNAAAIAAGTVRPVILAEFDFPGGMVRLWTGPADLTVFGDVFTGIGTIGAVSAVGESDDPPAVTYSLSGLDSATLALILSEKFRGRPCKHWLGFANADWSALVDDPYEEFAGRMDKVAFTDGPAGTLSLSAESEMADLHRPRIIRYTHEQQIARFPGDLGCEFVAQIPDRQFAFGFKLPTGTAPNGAPNPGSRGRLVGGRWVMR